VRLTLVCLATALAVARPAHGEEPAPLSVHFTAAERKVVTPKERKALEPELKTRLDQESKAMSALAKGYGKKLDTWPEGERATYREKLETTLQLESEIGWLRMGERDIADSLKDLEGASSWR
jgi:hypothetical protein